MEGGCSNSNSEHLKFNPCQFLRTFWGDINPEVSEVYIDNKNADFGMFIVSVTFGGKERHFACIPHPGDKSLAANVFKILSIDEIIMIDSTVLVGKSLKEVLDRFLEVKVGEEFLLLFRRHLLECDSFDYYAITGLIKEGKERPYEVEIHQKWVTRVKCGATGSRIHLQNDTGYMESVVSKNNSDDLRYLCVDGHKVGLARITHAPQDGSMFLKQMNYTDADTYKNKYCLIEHDEALNGTMFVNANSHKNLSVEQALQANDDDLDHIQNTMWFIPNGIGGQIVAYENEHHKGKYLWCQHDEETNTWQLELKELKKEEEIKDEEAVQFEYHSELN